jgi:UrcA family protein
MHPILSLLFVALIVFLGPECYAGTSLEVGYEVATREINFSDLNLNNNKGVATLYERIRIAAVAVCAPLDSRVQPTLRRARQCERQAIDRAVGDVNAPQLTSLHLAATNRMELASVK